jgi:hypothetical protein
MKVEQAGREGYGPKDQDFRTMGRINARCRNPGAPGLVPADDFIGHWALVISKVLQSIVHSL